MDDGFLKAHCGLPNGAVSTVNMNLCAEGATLINSDHTLVCSAINSAAMPGAAAGCLLAGGAVRGGTGSVIINVEHGPSLVSPIIAASVSCSVPPS